MIDVKPLNGLLLVDKPAGWTSHDVVAKVRSTLRTEFKISNSKFKIPSAKLKVGHTGTLDPAATGLMILVLGSYTKRAGEFSKLDKTYEAELTLGATSTTGDSEGEITQTGHRTQDTGNSEPSLEQIEKACKSFVGEIEQTPPAYSAIKIDGQRAYKLARKGQKPELNPRKVAIYQIRITEYRYPKLQIEARVSSGTYIRSLAEDIGAALGTGAYLSALRRTTVGKFKVENAAGTESLSLLSINQLLTSPL